MKAAAILPVALALAATWPAHADVLDLLQRSGAAVSALGAAAGLEGYHVTPAGDEEGYALWVTASGHAVVGLLYDAAGALVTADRLAAPGPAAPPPPSSTLPRDLPAIDDAAAAPPPRHGFTIGEEGPRVTVWADPACPFSRETVARLATAALDGRLVLEVVPVALLGASSAHMALAALDGATAWFDRRTTEPTPETTAAMRDNNAAFAAEGGEAVPLVVWSSAGAERRHTGAIADVDAFLAGSAP